MVIIKDVKFKDATWRPKVLVTPNDVPESGIKLLREKCDVTMCGKNTRKEILEKIKGVDAVFWGGYEIFDLEAICAAGPQLKCVSSMSVGVDHIDRDELKRRKIRLGNTPNVLNDAVADLGKKN
jgi:lactate dehydrogenase-like 2-hydroxyacid dehydrogenase